MLDWSNGKWKRWSMLIVWDKIRYILETLAIWLRLRDRGRLSRSGLLTQDLIALKDVASSLCVHAMGALVIPSAERLQREKKKRVATQGA